MTVQLLAYAAPTREESTEASLRKVLKDMDPLLDVKWVPTVVWNQLYKRWEGRYALTVDWPQADKRWAMVQSGEQDEKEAHDIVGWLCKDMSDGKSVPTGIDGIEGLVMEYLGKMDNTRYPWKQRFLGVIEANKKHRAQIKAEATDEFMDEAIYQYNKLYNVPIVAVKSDLKSKPKGKTK